MKVRLFFAFVLLFIALNGAKGQPSISPTASDPWAPFIYVGGVFTSSPTSSAQLGGAGIWNVDSGTWQEGGAANTVNVITSLLNGTKLYMAGNFSTIGNVPSTGQKPISASIAYLDTTTMKWKSKAALANGPILDLAIHPTTKQLWAVGGMTLMQPTLTGTGGVGYFIEELGMWTFAGGLPSFILADRDAAVHAIDFDSTGNAIIGGSPLFSAGITVLKGLAILRNNAWQTLGNGICGGSIKDLKVWEDKLFIGGNFTKVNDVDGDCGVNAIDAPGFAVYDLGTNTWSTMGSELSDGDEVNGFFKTDFESRPETMGMPNYMLITGNFNSFANETDWAKIVKFNGVSFEAATSIPVPVGSLGDLRTAATDGFNLYVGGSFVNESFSNIAKWDGSTWTDMNSGVFCSEVCSSSSVQTISPFFVLESTVVTPLSWGGFNLDDYVNWRYWLVMMAIMLIVAAILAILTNCCWKTIACCRACCVKPNPRKKEVGL